MDTEREKKKHQENKDVLITTEDFCFDNNNK
jgi:hypothetical protein